MAPFRLLSIFSACSKDTLSLRAEGRRATAFANSDSRELAGFKVARVEKQKKNELAKSFFCSFFHNSFEIWKRKLYIKWRSKTIQAS